MKKIFLSLAGAAIMVSCGAVASGTASKVGTSQMSLANTQWKLAETTKGKQPTLVIETGKISGNASCNNFFGEIVLDASNGSFDAKNIGSTRMACDNMSAESTYLKMLDEANKYVINGNTLELYKNNLLLMKLTKM